MPEKSNTYNCFHSISRNSFIGSFNAPEQLYWFIQCAGIALSASTGPETETSTSTIAGDGTLRATTALPASVAAIFGSQDARGVEPSGIPTPPEGGRW